MFFFSLYISNSISAKKALDNFAIFTIQHQRFEMRKISSNGIYLFEPQLLFIETTLSCNKYNFQFNNFIHNNGFFPFSVSFYLSYTVFLFFCRISLERNALHFLFEGVMFINYTKRIENTFFPRRIFSLLHEIGSSSCVTMYSVHIWLLVVRVQTKHM